jgi:glycine reductase
MAKEAERLGVASAHITAIPSVALSVGISRVVVGGGIPYPAGNPALPLNREKIFRRRCLETALRALTTSVDAPTLFQVEEVGED